MGSLLPTPGDNEEAAVDGDQDVWETLSGFGSRRVSVDPDQIDAVVYDT